MSNYIRGGCHSKILVSVISDGTSDGEAASNSAVHDRATRRFYTLDFLRIACFVVIAQSLSLSIFRENGSTVSYIGNVQNIMVNFSTNNGDHCSTATVVRVKHGHLSVNFGEHLFQQLVQLTPWLLLDLLAQLNWEHFLAVLTNSLATMTIKDAEDAAGLVTGDLVHVTVGVFHLRAESSILVLGIGILLHARRCFNVEADLVSAIVNARREGGVGCCRATTPSALGLGLGLSSLARVARIWCVVRDTIEKILH
jgi:hypothetical protein